jgi:hypothetical protein
MRPFARQRIMLRRPPTECYFMTPVIEQPAPAVSGIELRDEHDLRIWTGIAMWLGGACAAAAATVLPGSGTLHIAELRGLVDISVFIAIVDFVLIRSASNRALYVLTNILVVLGAMTAWFACFWSGGASSGFLELYYFPVLYVAYFFRAKQAVPQLVLISVLAASPLVYDGSLRGTQFPGHVAVLVAGFWGMSAVIGYRRRRLLLAELNLRKQALSDPLTGVHNLRSLRDRAAQQQLTQGTGVLVVDIDDFKTVNTEYGHSGPTTCCGRLALDCWAWRTNTIAWPESAATSSRSSCPAGQNRRSWRSPPTAPKRFARRDGSRTLRAAIYLAVWVTRCGPRTDELSPTSSPLPIGLCSERRRLASARLVRFPPSCP